MKNSEIKICNYSIPIWNFAVGLVFIWSFSDSDKYWIGWLLFLCVVVYTVMSQRMALINSLGIDLVFYLRPFNRHLFISKDRIIGSIWRGGHYAGSSFVIIKYIGQNGIIRNAEFPATNDQWILAKNMLELPETGASL